MVKPFRVPTSYSPSLETTCFILPALSVSFPRRMSSPVILVMHQSVDGVKMKTEVLLPDIEIPEEKRPSGKWGMMHRTYLQKTNPAPYNQLALTGSLRSCPADLNEQATDRFNLIMEQMMEAG